MRSIRISRAKLDVQFAAVINRVLTEDAQANNQKLVMPKPLLDIASDAYDLLTDEKIPASEWGV